MGAQSTKQDQGQYGNLSAEETLHLKKLFNSFKTQVAVVAPKGEKSLCGNCDDFRRYCEDYLDDWLALRVTERLAVQWPKQESLIPLHNYLNFVGNLLKGSLDEKVDIVWVVAQPPSTKSKDYISHQDLIQYTQGIIDSYLKCVQSHPSFKSWKEAGIVPPSTSTSDSIRDFAEFLLMDLLYSGVSNKEIIRQSSFSKDDSSRDELEKCFMSSALLQQLHTSVISTCFSMDVDSYFVRLFPSCLKVHPAFVPENYSVLDPARVLFLNSHLPSELRTMWRFLFSTAAHGESFAKMVGQIVGKGSTIVIVKDNLGRIFGSFNTDSWAFGPKFYGQKHSFFFHLHPKLVIYPTTGYNDNYQYFNVQQQTLPNGMGFGGKLEYFGIWLDAEFGKGKSSPSCTTYACPQMASSEEFTIHHMEVWGVGPEPTKDDNLRDEKSILDKDPEAKAMLEMIDRGTKSDGYRDEPHCND